MRLASHAFPAKVRIKSFFDKNGVILSAVVLVFLRDQRETATYSETVLAATALSVAVEV